MALVASGGTQRVPVRWPLPTTFIVRMRRLVLIILLLVYPFQLTLAMADGCCVTTPAGVTHHSAQAAADASGPVFLADDAVSALADPHCAACALGQLAGVPAQAVAPWPAQRAGVAPPGADPVLPSVPPARPERPNWSDRSYFAW